MKITKTKTRTKLTIALEGRLDATSAPELDELIKKELTDITEFVLDLEKLEYISSAGLRIIISAQKLMYKQGTMTVSHVQDAVMDVLELTGFADILTFA